MHWYLDVLKKYVAFDGRARRQEYWMFVLFNAIISFVLGFVLGFLHLGFLVHIYSLAILLPCLGLCTRRLHDTNKSGLWLLLLFVPFIGWLVLIAFFATEGNKGDNQYGADPKAN